MGIYNPDIKEWVRLVHEAGGLCFYDHANFNGVMGKIKARELGFDACMFMLHKTFGAPKGGGGPAVGAYGCTDALAPFLPKPVVVKDDKGYRLDYGRKKSAGKIREFFGNVPQVLKAYAWLLAMGRGRHRRGLRHLGARQQLHGPQARRRSAASRAPTPASPSIAWR